jgi:uncharacterized protein YdeI (YjbR/CyaY-like superfamily)
MLRLCSDIVSRSRKAGRPAALIVFTHPSRFQPRERRVAGARSVGVACGTIRATRHPQEIVMGSRDPRVDAYITKAAPFAQPILAHLREVVHAACPDVEETIKWGFPNFSYEGMLCSMASFKAHCAFSFWKGSLVTGVKDAAEEGGMGDFGRITTLKDLPSKKVLAGYVKEAMRLNEAGVKSPARSKPKVPKAELAVPLTLLAGLKKNAKARATFGSFSPSHRREYIEWITEAKREETRDKRVAQALEWLAEGKSRNWKYVAK